MRNRGSSNHGTPDNEGGEGCLGPMCAPHKSCSTPRHTTNLQWPVTASPPLDALEDWGARSQQKRLDECGI
eukprot:11961-Pelagomonas_calceolata.AAC.1